MLDVHFYWYMSVVFIFQWLLYPAGYQSAQYCGHDAVSISPWMSGYSWKWMRSTNNTFFSLVKQWGNISHVLTLALQGYSHHSVFRPCWTGLSGDVPVCGLWGKHDITSWVQSKNSYLRLMLKLRMHCVYLFSLHSPCQLYLVRLVDSITCVC